MNHLDAIISLLSKSHSVFHAVALMAEKLDHAGYTRLDEASRFLLNAGGKYYFTRNGSSVIAFRILKKPAKGYRIVATHNDSPTFVLKPKPLLNKGNIVSLNVEPYGGSLYYTWLDRPLSFAGRVYCLEDGKTMCTLVDVDEDCLVIPSLAIHQNREANNALELNAARDMVPLWGDKPFEGDFNAYLKERFQLEGDVLSYDLALYVREQPRLVGMNHDLLLAPRLDDLSSAYASLLAFLEAEDEEGPIPVFASFDNEEVGSLTAQGAHSDFLKNALRRIGDALGYDEQDRQIAQANSVMLSADNAHANHPNHPEKADATTNVSLNGGVVLKYNAEQRYTTSGRSSAYVHALALKLGDPLQEFANRSDLRGGSTLGNISNAEISLCTADIGIAQLAMHSSVELCGAEDIERMVRLLSAHYQQKEELV